MIKLIIYLFVAFSASAHEELFSLKCQQGGKELEVTVAPVGYQIELRNGDQILKRFLVSDFIINDFFDSKYKQIFDVYTAENNKVYLQIKRPETKGDVKTTVAVLKDPPNSPSPLEFAGCDLTAKKTKK